MDKEIFWNELEQAAKDELDVLEKAPIPFKLQFAELLNELKKILQAVDKYREENYLSYRKFADVLNQLHGDPDIVIDEKYLSRLLHGENIEAFASKIFVLCVCCIYTGTELKFWESATNIRDQYKLDIIKKIINM